MFQQTWKILLDKRSKTYVNDWKYFFYITYFIYLILGQFIDFFG